MHSIATCNNTHISMASHHINDSQSVNQKWGKLKHMCGACIVHIMNAWHCFHAVAVFENTRTHNLLSDAFPNKSQSLLSKLDFIARGKSTHIGIGPATFQIVSAQYWQLLRPFNTQRVNTHTYTDIHRHRYVCLDISFHLHFKREPEKPHHPILRLT